METTKITLEQAMQKVKNGEMVSSYPLFRVQTEIDSEQMEKIYTETDVLDLLQTITTNALSQDQINELIESVRDSISDLDTTDVIDHGSAEFSITYGNQIEIDTIDIDHSNIQDNVEASIKQFFKDLNNA